MTPLVFLHGWGQSSRVWFRQHDALAGRPVRRLDLPGHGGAAPAPADAWPERLLAALPEEPVILVGWSLGGMLALELAARHPDRVHALALVSTTPGFRNRPGWTLGCDDALLDDFAAGVEANSARAMGRFFALMLRGDALPRPRFNALAREAVERERPPHPEGLRAGLELLAGLDLRDRLPEIRHPCLVLHGREDAVVPFAAGAHLAETLPAARLAAFDRCGHAPFLTQPQRFNRELEVWCDTIT